MADSCSICWDCLGSHGGVAKTRCGEVLSCSQCLGTGLSFCGWQAASSEMSPRGAFWLTATQKRKLHTAFCLSQWGPFQHCLPVPMHDICCFPQGWAGRFPSGYIVIRLPSFYSRSPSCLAGHLFCTECIQQAQLADQRCPVCRGRAQPVRALLPQCLQAATAASGAAAAQCSGEDKPACLAGPVS